MRRYSDFRKVSEALSDLLVISKIMFSANLLDIIESQGPVLSYDSPPSTVVFVRFDYGEGIGYVLLCCKDMLIATAAREKGRKVFGDDALKLIRNKKGTSYIYSILLENLPDTLRSSVERAVGECRELHYPDSLLGTQLYGLKIGNNVLVKTEFIVVLPAELDNRKQILVLPSDTLVVSKDGKAILSSLALDFSVALANRVEVSSLFIPRTEYGSVNDLVAAPPSLVIPWASATSMDNLMKQGKKDFARSILKRVTQYLIRAHEIGIAHLWLDPKKILVTSVPGTRSSVQILITGFLGRFPKGLIRFANPFYCDPYLLLGLEGIHTDVYSLGMIVLETMTGLTLESRAEIVLALRDALVGTQPSGAKGKSDLYSLIFSTARKDPSKLKDAFVKIMKNDRVVRRDRATLAKVRDKKLRDVLVRCLSLDISERPKEAKELLNAL